MPSPAPIERSIDSDDTAAGLTSLAVPYRGQGTFSIATAPIAPAPDAPIVRQVQVSVEDGLDVSARAFGAFVMDALSDFRGWGSGGRMAFVQTEGAADVRVVIASPYTAATMCKNRDAPIDLDGAQSSDSGSPGASANPADATCASQGYLVVDAYEWATGLHPYADDRTGARQYLLNHGVGHLLGKPNVACTGALANIMVNQRKLPAGCAPNPWPFPRAEAS